MKLSYRSDRMLFEIEGESAKELFRAVAEIQSIFEADKNCGRCNSPNLHFRVRTPEKGDYYELVCLDCLATLSFGQPRKGSLFPQRRDAEKNALSHRGWRVAWGGKAESDPDFAEVAADGQF